MNNPKERRCGRGSCEGGACMNGGDYGCDAAVKVYDVVRMGDHLQGQVVSSYGVVRVDNIDV